MVYKTKKLRDFHVNPRFRKRIDARGLPANAKNISFVTNPCSRAEK